MSGILSISLGWPGWEAKEQKEQSDAVDTAGLWVGNELEAVHGLCEAMWSYVKL